ncbi:MAG: tRNA (adenosine(37)-N6)-threonylcarbamoyltransferase complex dimerization subunit type 1 TsaB [Lachnospiraceae bacterium]|nr:tRNA (adenosine(37)-N6)-threonylcarbamoyltransferase complex dimerization subunit type 1 TsaB [Lachnospiraceae bacterium]
MKIVGIESASLVASVAVAEDDSLVAEYTLNYKKTHSQTLLPMLAQIGEMVELDWDGVDAIAVSGGPGSFTGLRIGAATAKGLGLARNIPLIHVPTLDAMAYAFFGTAKLICPMLDAKRGQVYAGLYRFAEAFETVKPSCAVDLKELLSEINERGEPVIFSGDGVPMGRSVIEENCRVSYAFAPLHLNRQRAAAVAALGFRYLMAGRTENAAQHAPDYLRVSQAEREMKERTGIALGEKTVSSMEVSDLPWVAGREREFFSDAWSEQALSETLAAPGSKAYLVCLGREPAGYFLGKCAGDEAEVYRIAVTPRFREMGLGRLLLETFLTETGKEGVSSWFLEVRSRNREATALYESLGFKTDGRRKGYYRNPADDALLMSRRGGNV